MLQKMSLRSKLLIITALSLLALLSAFASAWRTARMSETFALRQAEGNVAQAAREILREAGDEARKPKRRLPPTLELAEISRSIRQRQVRLSLSNCRCATVSEIGFYGNLFDNLRLAGAMLRSFYL